MDKHSKLNFVEVNCPLCKSQSFKKIYNVQHFNDDILPKIGVEPPFPPVYVNECTNCGHHFASPQLSDEALDKYYSEINSEYYIEGEAHDKLLAQHEFVISKIEKSLAGGKVLEIGCGCGYLLHLFNKQRWDVVGVEPFGEACQFAKNRLGLNVIHGYLDEKTFPDKHSFDVVMMFDVMEHLKDPVSILNLVNFYLKPGGLLVIGTGDIGSINAKLSKDKWAYLTLREHLSFYSEKSIKYYLRDFSKVAYYNVSYSGNTLLNMGVFINNQIIRRAYNTIQAMHYGLTKFKLTRFPYIRYNLAFDHMLVIAQK